MRRSLWVALLFGGVGLTALAQDTPDTAPVPEETAPPATDAGTPGAVDGIPDVGSEDATAPGIEPPAADEPAVDDAPPPVNRGPLPGRTLPDAGRPGTALPADPEVRQPDVPETDVPDIEVRGAAGGVRRQETFEDAEPLPRNDVFPRDDRLPPGADVRDADGQGAPLIDEGLAPQDDPLREPIERQPLPDTGVTQPLPPDPDGVGPIPPRRRPRPILDVDPAYGTPAPPRVQPEIEIGEVVRNPVRIYEARLLVLMGHTPAATDAINILARRFPTDARVPYLRFFLLSRTGQREAALESLRQAVALERLYPMTDYNRFMEPLQGPDRFYAERVRRAAAELAAVDGLVEPDPDELLPEETNGPAPADAPPPETEPAPQPVPEDLPPQDTPPQEFDEPAPPAEPLPPEAEEPEGPST